MRTKTYPSDVNREQLESIRPLLERARKKTKPHTVDLYEVFCAMLYLLRTGYRWRVLPSDFPKWRTLHSYWGQWSQPDEQGLGLLGQALKNQLGVVHEKLGCNACSTHLIVVGSAKRQELEHGHSQRHSWYATDGCSSSLALI